tara:strand:- start:77012 stop:77380 length:369 start_codon:yes stop_codon:yes gene_type:complete
LGQPIDVGSFVKAVWIVRTDVHVAKIIDKEDHKVWTSFRLSLSGLDWNPRWLKNQSEQKYDRNNSSRRFRHQGLHGFFDFGASIGAAASRWCAHTIKWIDSLVDVGQPREHSFDHSIEWRVA